MPVNGEIQKSGEVKKEVNVQQVVDRHTVAGNGVPAMDTTMNTQQRRSVAPGSTYVRPSLSAISIMENQGNVQENGIQIPQQIEEVQVGQQVQAEQVQEEQVQEEQVQEAQQVVSHLDEGLEKKKVDISVRFDNELSPLYGDTQIGVYEKNAPEGYVRRLKRQNDEFAGNRVAELKKSFSSMLDPNMLAGSKELDKILGNVALATADIGKIADALSDKKNIDKNGMFMLKESGFDVETVSKAIDRVLNIRQLLDKYISGRSGIHIFSGIVSKGKQRLKAARKLRDFIDYELISSLKSTTEVVFGDRPAAMKAVENQIQPEKEQDKHLETLVKTGIEMAVAMNPDTMTYLTEEEQRTIEAFCGKGITREEADETAVKMREHVRKLNSKIYGRDKDIEEGLKRMGLNYTGGAFKRLFLHILSVSDDPQTLEAEDQLIEAVCNADIEKVRNFSHQVHDQILRLPSNVNDYINMDFDKLFVLKGVGFMFSELQKREQLFPETEKDPVLLEIADIKNWLVNYVYLIKAEKVTLAGGYDGTTGVLNYGLRNAPEAKRRNHANNALPGTVGNLISEGMVKYKKLEARLKADPVQWKKYKMYFEDPAFSSLTTVKLTKIGDAPNKEGVKRLSERMVAAENEALANIKTAYDNFKALNGTGMEYKIMLLQLRKMNELVVNPSFSNKMEGFNELLLNLSDYIAAAENEEYKTRASLMRVEIVRYMVQNHLMGNEVFAFPGDNRVERTASQQRAYDEIKAATKIGSYKNYEEYTPDYEYVMTKLYAMKACNPSSRLTKIINHSFFLVEADKQILARIGIDDGQADQLHVREQMRRSMEVRRREYPKALKECRDYIRSSKNATKKAVVTEYYNMLERLRPEYVA